MNYPLFYDLAPRIPMRDPLAELLGALTDGYIEYCYLDAVKLAGHSCPTVAGAYLTARAAIAALYPGEPGERGGVAIRMPSPEGHGTTGVTAQVLTIITGAAADNGFKGLNDRFVRHSLLSYSTAPTDHPMLFTRCDSGATVAVALDLSSIAYPANLRELLASASQPSSTCEHRVMLKREWQRRVEVLLLDHADDPLVVRLTHLT